MRRQLVYGPLVIDLRDDAPMLEVTYLMDFLEKCYAYGGEFTYYGSDGTVLEGDAEISRYTRELIELGVEDLPF